MVRRRRDAEALRRAEERRAREDDAGKLNELVPGLSTLRLEIDETQEDNAVAGARHIRHVVVDYAPALFDFPCTAQGCQDGGHDVTAQILRALQDSRLEFSGDNVCRGQIGDGECGRVLQFVAFATYGSDPASDD